MHLEIPQNKLNKLVSVASGVAPRKSPRPILTYLLLESTENNLLSVKATDGELSFSGEQEAIVKEPGKAVVSARDFHEIIKNLPDKPVTLIHHPDNNLEIQCGKIYFQLNTIDPSEFPEIPQIEPETSYRYSTSEFLKMIEKTLFAVSLEETRYYLGGVFLEKRQYEDMRAVATDAHRLSLVEMDPPEGLVELEGKILPRKLLAELKRALDQKNSELLFGFKGRHVLFKSGSQTFISLLIEGDFPDYRQVLPTQPEIICRVHRVELLEALKRTSLLSPDRSGGVKFMLSKKFLVLHNQRSDRGSARQEVELVELRGPAKLEIGFNARYFIEALSAIETADVLIEFTDNMSPCVIRPYIDYPEGEDPEYDEMQEKELEKMSRTQKDHLNLIMPMRL